MKYLPIGKSRDSGGRCRIFDKPFLIMKLTAFLVLGMVTATYADGMAQRLSLSLKNANLEAIFAEIASRTSYRFLYSDDAVRAVNRMDVQWKDVSIEQALHDVLKGHDLLYRIVAET